MDFTKSFRELIDKLESWVSTLIIALPNIAVAIVVMLIFIAISKITKSLVLKILTKTSATVAVAKLLSKVVAISIIVAGLFISLGILQLDRTVTSLLAGVGIIGLALGFAFQDIASNFISGVLIAVRKPFDIGDIIKSKDYFGKVVSMNIRTTNLRTFQGQIVLIPNKEVYQNPIVNYTETGERRIDLSVGVSYGDDLEKARKVAIEAVKGIPNLREDKGITFYYDEFKDSSINFNIRLWVDYKGDNRYYLQVKNDGIMRIKKAFEENDISIPFPIRTLDFGIKGGEKLNEVIDVKSFSDGGNN